MTIYLVWVNARSSGRFVDSIWIKKEHAAQRVSELKESLACAGHSASEVGGLWYVWWSKATASDAVLEVQDAA